jgi:ATP-dependent Clp protease ATP-binding subunit ClpA
VAIMSAPAPDHCLRILESLALWDAQGRALAAVPVEEPAPPTLSLASYTKGARQIVARAQSLADERRHAVTTAIHVFARLFALAPVQERARSSGADPEAALAAAESWLEGRPRSERPSYLSAEALAMLERADKMANGQPVSLNHLVTAFLAPPRQAMTVEDLDRDGVVITEEEEARQQIITAGRLARLAEGTK